MSWILGIATATPQVSVALAGPDGLAGEVSLRAGRRHGETLAPAIEALLRLTGVALPSIDTVAVDVGPGLFTGLRVGVATAKALGSALRAGVVPCSSLEVLAHPHRRVGRPVASVVDARRGEVFWALYEPGPTGLVPASNPVVARPEALLAELSCAGPAVLAVGDGAGRYLRGTGVDVAPEEFEHPSAGAMVVMAASRPAVAADKVTPNYMREADVRIGWEQR